MTNVPPVTTHDTCMAFRCAFALSGGCPPPPGASVTGVPVGAVTEAST